jgi:hypothetical protein
MHYSFLVPGFAAIPQWWRGRSEEEPNQITAVRWKKGDSSRDPGSSVITLIVAHRTAEDSPVTSLK